MKSNKKRGLVLILVILIAGLLIAMGIFLYKVIKLNEKNKQYEALNEYKNEEIIEEQPVQDDVEVVETNEEIKEVSEEYVSPIEFDKLQAEVNADIYAWICIEDTAIDYPVLFRQDDNSYYLQHNLDGSIGYPGCIYTENFNSLDFKDQITVVYGHNMKNGSMFAGLHKFKDREYFDNHEFIEIYMPEEKKTYQILGAYYTDNKRITTWYKTSTSEGAKAWIDTIGKVQESDRDHLREIEYGYEDNYIVLETCVGKDKSHRLVVVGVEKENCYD